MGRKYDGPAQLQMGNPNSYNWPTNSSSWRPSWENQKPSSRSFVGLGVSEKGEHLSESKPRSVSKRGRVTPPQNPARVAVLRVGRQLQPAIGRRLATSLWPARRQIDTSSASLWSCLLVAGFVCRWGRRRRRGPGRRRRTRTCAAAGGCSSRGADPQPGGQVSRPCRTTNLLLFSSFEEPRPPMFLLFITVTLHVPCREARDSLRSGYYLQVSRTPAGCCVLPVPSNV
jgi:hypothetical protein